MLEVLEVLNVLTSGGSHGRSLIQPVLSMALGMTLL